MKNKKTLMVIVLVVVVGILFFLFFRDKLDIFKNNLETNPYDEFAQCITDSEAKFYCSWWAPFCNKQKQIFGSSTILLPYIECSAPGSKQQNLRCRKDDIEAYPTWEFANGNRIEDFVSFDGLEKETGCKAPIESKE